LIGRRLESDDVGHGFVVLGRLGLVGIASLVVGLEFLQVLFLVLVAGLFQLVFELFAVRILNCEAGRPIAGRARNGRRFLVLDFVGTVFVERPGCLLAPGALPFQLSQLAGSRLRSGRRSTLERTSVC
jgi:hypothetical protein